MYVYVIRYVGGGGVYLVQDVGGYDVQGCGDRVDAFVLKQLLRALLQSHLCTCGGGKRGGGGGH